MGTRCRRRSCRAFATICANTIPLWRSLQFGNSTTLPDRFRNFRTGENTRELIIMPMPYIVIYGVDSDFVHIFRVIHGAEDR